VAKRGAGQLEAEVLTALWAAEQPITAADVHAAVGQDLADTTVMTILTRLIRKGLVERTRDPGARVYRYFPTSGRAEHLAEQMHTFLASGDDHRAVLARFLGRLSAADQKTAADLLRRRSS
jgi:predicted transcriptional regulator